MKTREEIENKIKEFEVMIEEMHDEREGLIEKHGAVTEEYNKDFFHDLHQRLSEIMTLKWVLDLS